MIVRRFFQLCALSFVICASCSTAQSQIVAPKRRIAVLNFDFPLVDPHVLSDIFGGSQDIGRGVSAMLIAKLVQDGRFTVIEYSALDKVLAEQNLARSERADPDAAAKVGRILGVDAIILGSITRFGPETIPKNDSGKMNSRAMMGGGNVGTKTTKSKAVVDLTIQIVNPATSELIATMMGTGLSKEAGTFFYANIHTKQGNFDFTSTQFANTVLGEATNNAVNQTATQLLALADKIPYARYEINGVVAEVAGNELTLNVGSADGLKLGQTLRVNHIVSKAVVPLPNGGVREFTDDVGTATITALETVSATATFAGKGPVTIGDGVTNLP
ncbi:MAG TPA: CsgG/HfaB family protein [Candidatus Acidoferrum sp.]|nr:CsgG/HfaB family protein [Candidatus Acidoferrum sp.]